MDKAELTLQIKHEYNWDGIDPDNHEQVEIFAQMLIDFAEAAECDISSYRVLMFEEGRFAYHCLMITDPQFNHEMSLEYQIIGPDVLHYCFMTHLYDHEQGPHPQFVMEDGYYLVLFTMTY
ncbi:MAG: hypothetical protein JRE40_00245 [Deltaproteobacteria bacterium]|nr:hypothetical protein [Deltaproteobacteria bacterium]